MRIFPTALAACLVAVIAAPAFAADMTGGRWNDGRAPAASVDVERAPGGWGYGAPPAEERVIPFSANLPACDAPPVLAEISSSFDRREARFWNSGLRIVDIEHVRDVAFRPWGASFIPRRHCTAVAHVTHGERVREHRVNYQIREELGVLWNASYGVDWCVVGVERHLHAAPECRMMLP